MSDEIAASKTSIADLHRHVILLQSQLAKAIEHIAKLEKVISLMPGPFACEDFHHDKKDRHKNGECPVRNRFEAALKACEKKEATE